VLKGTGCLSGCAHTSVLVVYAKKLIQKVAIVGVGRTVCEGKKETFYYWGEVRDDVRKELFVQRNA
jgi:hypothetical protein